MDAEAGEFHLSDGLTVKRMPGDRIRIRWAGRELLVADNEFASFVCHASSGGETADRFHHVEQFLRSEGDASAVGTGV